MSLIALSITSCTSDDAQNGDTSASIEKTSVNFSVAQDSKQTSKTIDRGNIPLYVDNLTIKAASNALTPWIATETFNFTGGVTTAAPQLTLADVALGLNTFSATSTSATANKVFELNNASSSSLTTLLAKTPYIPCYSFDNPTRTIIAGTNSVVPLKMKTDHGRIVSLFKIESPDADNYRVIVTATVGSTTLTRTIDPTTANRFITFEWTNENAIKDAVVTFNIKVYEVSAPNTVLRTITKTLKIIDSKSISCVYTLTNNDVHEDITTGGITITFPTIDEVNCEDMYDDEGYNCHGYNNDGKDKNGQNAFDNCGYHKIIKTLYKAKFDQTPNDNGTVKCS